jgi:predicted ATP-grasp superfamily ATP-dependent carboligase
VKLFVFESITGGGLADRPLPASLAAEGERMLQALLDDLLEIEGVEVLTSRDARLPPLRPGVQALAAGDRPITVYARGVAWADAVWPIAPETGGMLERLSRLVLESGKRLLGSHPEAVAVAASKRRTAAVLAAHGIPVAPAFDEASKLPDLPGPWVVKPDDGAGCVDTLRVADRAGAAAMLAARPDAGLIAQPWIAGDALSLSLLCGDGQAELLSVNRQHIGIRGERLELDHVTAAALPPNAAFRRLADDVARALPGLRGYAGIDFMLGAAGLVVIEINPRLTTACCGLRRALGVNVAARVLALARRLHEPA